MSEASRQSRRVGVFKGPNLVVGEVHIDRCRSVWEMVRLSGPHDGSADNGVLQHPSQPPRRHGNAASLGCALDRVHYCSVALAEEPLPNSVMIKALGVLTPRSCKPSLCQWTPGKAADRLIGEQSEHLALFLALHQVVQVLHGYELGPAVQLGDVLHLRKLPGPHRRGADVAGLACLDDI